MTHTYAHVSKDIAADRALVFDMTHTYIHVSGQLEHYIYKALICDMTDMQHTVTHCNSLQHAATYCSALQRTATHCNTLQYTTTRCNTLQHTATHCNTIQHNATQCNTMQHTATHCRYRALICVMIHTCTHVSGPYRTLRPSTNKMIVIVIVLAGSS